MRPRLLLICCVPLFVACEQLGIDDAVKIAATREAEGRAVGGGCRHSGRALEDCYIINPKASKAAVFAGWRDMDAYMRENNIETATPQLAAAKDTKPEQKEAKPEQKTGAESKDTKDAKAGDAGSKEAVTPAKPAEKH